jgi:hypothetical protein
MYGKVDEVTAESFENLTLFCPLSTQTIILIMYRLFTKSAQHLINVTRELSVNETKKILTM